MSTIGYTLFETTEGELGIAWSASGVTCTQWPEGSREATRRRLVARTGGGVPVESPPAFVREAITKIRGLVDEGADELGDIPIDLARTTEFRRRVYDLARGIPPGQTKTYGEVAALAGSPGASRAVGQAMAQNPVMLIVPCHRVIASGGALGGFSAPGGLTTKQMLLTRERMGGDQASAVES